MKSFRLLDVKIDIKNYKTEKISLVDKNINDKNNYFSLIIGNNGTGKSRFLSTVCRYFTRSDFTYKDENKDEFINFTTRPKKIISVCHSISDKFPHDQSFNRTNKDESQGSYSDMEYVYLGTRNRANSFSSNALMERALDILLENYTKKNIASSYRYLFEYLNYEPVIKLRYKIKSIEKMSLLQNKNMTVEKLKQFFEAKAKKGFNSFRHRNIEKIIENNNKELDDICYFYNNLEVESDGFFNLLINFSIMLPINQTT